MVLRLFAALSVVCAAVLVAIGHGERASACSCDLVDPIDAIAEADAVFFGVARGTVPVEGLESYLDAWRFDVEGVIKGDVEAEEIVLGHNEGSSCGPTFRTGMGSTVVFATEWINGHFEKWACVGADPETLVPRLEEPVLHRGTGPPAAVRVGAVGRTDIAVLDADGRSLGAALLGVVDGGVPRPTPCADTTSVALVTPGGQTRVRVVDLARWELTSEIYFRVAIQPDAAIACYDGGERVAVTNFDDGFLRVFTAITMGERFLYEAPAFIYEAGADYSSAVFHPAGTALLLPAGGAALRAIDVRDFERPPLAEVALPEGASVAHGAVSPDGSRLAMLATLDGTPSAGRTPNTHVIVADLADGVPVDGSVSTVALQPDSAAWPDGPALRIEWVDDETWVIEHVGNVDDWVEFVAADGTQLLPPTDIGNGSELIPVPGGIVREQFSGIQSVTPDGAIALGDPGPDGQYERHLTIGNMRGLTEFTPTDASPPAYVVSPPLPSRPPSVVSTVPAASTEAPAEAAAASAVSDGPGVDASDDDDSNVLVAVAIGVGIVVVGAAMALGLRRARRASHSGSI